jgi:hypothetical protein
LVTNAVIEKNYDMKQTFLLVVLACTLFTGSSLAQGLYDRASVQKIELFFGFSNWDAQLDALATTTEDYLLADSVRINGITFDSVGVTVPTIKTTIKTRFTSNWIISTEVTITKGTRISNFRMVTRIRR